MQIIFQDPYGSLNPRMTIESAIIEPMVIQGIESSRKARRDRAASLLEEVGLNSSFPAALSARVFWRSTAENLHRAGIGC